MKPDFVIHPAREADIPAVLSIYTSCQDSLPPLNADGFAALLRRNLRRGSVLLAVCDSIISGVCVYSPRLCRISLLAVQPAARGKGIATALLDEALRRLPPGDVIVETFCDGDTRGKAALAFYQKYGFRPYRKLSGYDQPMQQLRLHRK